MCTSGFCQSHCTIAHADEPPSVFHRMCHFDHWQCSRARMGRYRNSRTSHVLSNTCRGGVCGWFSCPGSGGFNQCQVAGVQQCLVHLLTLHSSCRGATGDACLFLAGFCRCCSAFAKCSGCSNGHRRGRESLASSFQPHSIVIVRCANHPFLDLLMAFCRLELCNRPDQISRALDWIASSSFPVMLWTSWCTIGCYVAQVPLCFSQCWGQTISCAPELVCLSPHA